MQNNKCGLLILAIFTTHSIYYSQPFVMQDEYLNENFFKNKKNGVFIDIGAYDGITHSNTYFFERELGWKGICFEPITPVFNLLQSNRSCICLNGCAADKNDQALFIEASGYAQMLSGLVDSYDPRHLKRLLKENEQFGGSYQLITVPTFNITEKILESGFDRVDYLSLDTEGSELLILKSINFNKIVIQFITVENNYNDPAIREYLEKNGFEYLCTLGHQDEVYVNSKF